MNLIRTIAFVVLATLAVGVSAHPAQPQAQYFVMRHLQKNTVGDDPGLTEQGAINSRLLAQWEYRWPGFPRLTAIYVSKAKRAQDTARPIALRFGIQPKIYESMEGLIASVEHEVGAVLIVGHSNTVPDIVERLGGNRPAAIPESRYGDIWYVWGPAKRRSGSRKLFP